MGIRMTVSTITKSWNAFVSHKWLMVIAVVIDIVFLISVNQMNYALLNRANEYSQTLTTMLGEQAQAIADANTLEPPAVLQSDEFTAAYRQLLKFIGFFFAGILLSWIVCKGSVWFLAHKSAKEKPVDAKLFATKFIGMTLFWFGGFLILTIVAMNIIDYALMGALPLFSTKTANVIVAIIFWAYSYFVFISYALVPHNVFKQTFTLGITQWKEMLPAHVLGTIVLALSITIPFLLVRISVYLIPVFALLVALPAIAWTRTLWITAVHKVMSHEQN
jgi:hypothetical protein